MTVLMTRDPQKRSKPFANQEFFQDFNWDKFEAGDIIWLQDYEGPKVEGQMIAGVIARFDFNNPVIRVLPPKAAKLLEKIDAAKGPLETVIGYGYFEKFQYH